MDLLHCERSTSLRAYAAAAAVAEGVVGVVAAAALGEAGHGARAY